MAADSNIRGAGSTPVLACNSLRSVIGTAKQRSEPAGAIPVAAHSNCRRGRPGGIGNLTFRMVTLWTITGVLIPLLVGTALAMIGMPKAGVKECGIARACIGRLAAALFTGIDGFSGLARPVYLLSGAFPQKFLSAFW